MENLLEQYQDQETEQLRIEIINWVINRPMDVVALSPELLAVYNRVQFQRKVA